MRTALRLATAALALTFVACSDDDETPDASVTPDAGFEATDAGFEADAGFEEADAGVTLACTEPMPPDCQDEAVSELGFRDVMATGGITEEGVTPGETTYVDARAGGFSVTQSFLYARFTDEGLEKVEITDEEAFDDMTWHIAFRRYIVRLNGGIGGPSCVVGGRVPNATYEEVTEVGETPLFEEAYFTDSCELVNDGSGLPGAPATVLSSFWEYPGCVKMTGNVFVVQLPDGRAVKLEVLSYYDPAKQQECQDTNQASSPSGSGNLRIRWAFL